MKKTYITLRLITGTVLYFKLDDQELKNAMASYEKGSIQKFITKDDTHYIRMNSVIDFMVGSKEQ